MTHPPRAEPPSPTRSLLASAAFVVLLAAAVTACGKKDPSGSAAGGPGGPGGAAPPAEVGVVTTRMESVPLVTELPGRLEASRTAQVRARAAGIVTQRVFREGSDVKQGQVLFRVDPAPYAAQVASAQATLARAQANAANAKATADRYRPLVEANAISRQDYANAVALQKTSEAEVAAARAAVQSAQINLGYSTVTAPIAGRIGRALVTEGALVGQGDATPLAIIQQIDPLYINFTQSATEALRLRQAVESGQLRQAGPGGAPVRVVLEDGSLAPQAGRLLFSDLTVDQASGQVTLRAEVPNPGAALLPGLYVRVRLEQASADNAVRLPQQALTRGAQGDSVMVVDPQGQVQRRPVKVGSGQGGQWIILDGLKAGEQVVVDGFQKIRPNVPVKPVPWSPPAANGSARPASAAGASAAASAPGASANAAPPASGTPRAGGATPANAGSPRS